MSIPAAENASVVDIGRKLVPIEALDEIGRAAFAGMKSLNRFFLADFSLLLFNLDLLKQFYLNFPSSIQDPVCGVRHRVQDEREHAGVRPDRRRQDQRGHALHHADHQAGRPAIQSELMHGLLRVNLMQSFAFHPGKLTANP